MSWIVTASAQHARVFELRGSEIVLLETTEHAREVGDEGDEQTASLARELALKLRNARIAGRYERLILMAPPTVMSVLRGALDDVTRKHVVASVSGDVDHLPGYALLAHLPPRAMR